ncbi:hypothetical protein LEMLEM_LOCUS17630 [Lemmus lemmus]
MTDIAERAGEETGELSGRRCGGGGGEGAGEAPEKPAAAATAGPEGDGVEWGAGGGTERRRGSRAEESGARALLEVWTFKALSAEPPSAKPLRKR